MGVLEEGVKTAGGVVDALRANPLALANIVLNIAFLVFLFYYVTIIAHRAEGTVKELFQAQDNVFKQWGVMVKDQQGLTEKMMHCILPEDALKLLQAPRVQPQNWPPYAPPKLTPLRQLWPAPPASLDFKLKPEDVVPVPRPRPVEPEAPAKMEEPLKPETPAETEGPK
jgi:hypothetical protein